MKSPRRSALLVAAFATAGLVGTSIPAFAVPPSAHPDATYTCSDGSVIDVVTLDADNGVAWIDGRGVSARAFQFTGEFTATVLDGPYAGDVLTSPFQSGVTRSHVDAVNPKVLNNTVTCVGEHTDNFGKTTLTQDDLDFLGADSKYLGAKAALGQTFTLTVYVTSQLIAHR
jgi:hypothetical protein